MSYIIPDARFEAPSLLTPYEKPINSLRLDTTTPLGALLSSVPGWAAIATPGGFYDIKNSQLAEPTFAGNGGEFTENGWENASLGRVTFEITDPDGYSNLTNDKITFGLAGFTKQLDDSFDGVVGIGTTASDNASSTRLAFGNLATLRVYTTGSILASFDPGTSIRSPFVFAVTWADSDLYSDETHTALNVNNSIFTYTEAAATGTVGSGNFINIGDSTATNIVNIKMAFAFSGYMPKVLLDSFVRNPYQCLIPA